eukprot:TRINITY_DN2267_c0_g4_i1.p1 TRINITY_DN2267_c0_g4~~TRINITY_DN2267_c0_g4_i1.p1  ORF type:complete len:165 (+),score=52.24 TRINITY_DN2267_c0_g4_i1:3-497(+)
MRFPSLDPKLGQRAGLRIMGAHQIPQAGCDLRPFVCAIVLGALQDSCLTSTPVCDEDRWCPSWDSQLTLSISRPQEATISLVVLGKTTQKIPYFLGRTTFAVSTLRRGLRSFPLFDQKGNRVHGSYMLVEITIEEVQMEEIANSQPIVRTRSSVALKRKDSRPE